MIFKPENESSIFWKQLYTMTDAQLVNHNIFQLTLYHTLTICRLVIFNAVARDNSYVPQLIECAGIFNSLPNDKPLELSKEKAFAIN